MKISYQLKDKWTNKRTLQRNYLKINEQEDNTTKELEKTLTNIYELKIRDLLDDMDTTKKLP
jgi:hypothetical protein